MIVDKSQWPCGLLSLCVKDALQRLGLRDYIAQKAAKQTEIEVERIAWAVRMLLKGYDSPCLIDLAGLDLEGYPIDPIRAEQLFQASLVELAIGPKADADVLRTWLGERAKQIVDGQIDPVEAVDLIHDEIIGPLEHPDDLMQWCYARGGFFMGPDDKSTNFSEEEWPGAVIELAKQWANSESLLAEAQ